MKYYKLSKNTKACGRTKHLYTSLTLYLDEKQSDFKERNKLTK